MPTQRVTNPAARRLRRSVAVLGTLLSLGLAAGPVAAGATARVSPAAAPLLSGRFDGPLVPRQGALFGTWIRRGAGSVEENLGALREREAQLGRRFDISQHFYPFDKPFPSVYEADDIANGRIPMIAWNGSNADAIAAGDHDALIDQRGRALAALDTPVFLRWFWEPEAKADRMSSPAAYIAAWRHVHERVTAAGATNVAWVWCPTAYGFANGVAPRFYPGDDVVDWVCADGYNWAPGRSGDQWRDWAWIYRPAHAFAVAHGKPLMAGEWGVQERDPGEKAAWMDEARNAIRTQFPNLAAVVAFDENRLYDWRVDATTESLAAFTRWANDPWFHTRAPADPGNGGDNGDGDDGTDTPDAPLFADDFLAGLAKWQGKGNASVRNGELTLATRRGGGFASARLDTGTEQSWTEVSVRLGRRGPHSVRLLTLRAADGAAIVGVGVRRNGELIIVDDSTGARSAVAGRLTPRHWATLRLSYDATTGTAAVSLGGSTPVSVTEATLRSEGVKGIELGDRGGRSQAKRFSMTFRAVTLDDAPLAAA